MKIGILNTSNDESRFAKSFPNDGQKFCMLMAPARPDWTFGVVHVKDNVFPDRAEDFDGYVITGSPASVLEPLDWIARLLDFIRELHARQHPLVGVCFGHQAVALALDGVVEKAAAGWGMGTAVTHYTEHRAWMVPPRGGVTLYASHSDQVTTLPAGATLLGGNDFCPYAAFEIGRHIMTTQYHPELTAEFMTTLVDLMARKEMLPEDIVASAREQLRWKEDGVLFAEWMLRFLESAR